jgi:hypothetical protein
LTVAEASDFVNGADVEWARLGRTLVGATIGAWFTGLVSVLLGLSDLPLAVAEWLAGFLGKLVELVVGIPAGIVRGSWAPAAAFLEGTGPAGFVLALAIVLLTLYVVARVVNLL